MSQVLDLADTQDSVVSLGGWDHVEFWVGNARAFAGFLSAAFGFEIVGYSGPETGSDDRASYVLRQGDITFEVTGAVRPDSPVAAHVQAHGDGVRDVAFTVADAGAVYEAVLERGATGTRAPHVFEDDDGRFVYATIAAYGDTQHSFVERRAFHGTFAPSFITEKLPPAPRAAEVGLEAVDHVVANVEKGALAAWVQFYEKVLGFGQLVHFDDEQISTEYSALVSTVVWNGNRIKLPINEPAEGRRKSQIQEYLDYYGCPGVQHLALRTSDIVRAVGAMRERGVRFLDVPASYYADAKERMAGIDLPWADLQRLGILVDRDEEGHLLQIFTENITDRPTVFFEIIQREGATGFGEGNFKALFEAIEREQARRGNL